MRTSDQQLQDIQMQDRLILRDCRKKKSTTS